MNLSQYISLVNHWRKKYAPIPKHINLTNVSTACLKCGKIRSKMHRHHIANDFFFARLLPDTYARRYVEYHPDDIAKLCHKCHNDIHKIYYRLQVELWEILAEGMVITPDWCEEQKERFREMFKRWLKTKPRRKQRANRANRT